MHLVWAPLVFTLGYLDNNKLGQFYKTQINHLALMCRKPRSANAFQNMLGVFKKKREGEEWYAATTTREAFRNNPQQS